MAETPSSGKTMYPDEIEDNGDDDDEDEESWNEIMECESQLACLFCEDAFKTMAVALEHCKAVHQFDLIGLKRKFNMDCYSYISLINYVRREGATPEQISDAITAVWNDVQYLQPAVPEDPWLMFDFDGLESPIESRPESPHLLKNVNGVVTMEEKTYLQMQWTIQQLKAEVARQNESLLMAAKDLETMKSVTQNLVTNISDEQDLTKVVGKLRINEDHGYFSSYSHFGIHHTMLRDKPRTLSYRDAILNNAETIAGKVVLDVGCGSAILSMFCAQAGASAVIGVDQSDIIYHAMDIVRENGMEKKVQLLKGRVEEVSLPVEKVDVIVSEWMGYFLLFEGMLDAVLLARDKFLRPNGIILPNVCSISLVGVSDLESYEENIGFWNDVYGYKMSCLKREMLQEAYIVDVSVSSIATAPSTVCTLDLMTCTPDSTSFASDFHLVCTKDCTITAICGYFDTVFQLAHSVTLSTSPVSEKTHWKQTVFFLPQPINATSGMTVIGRISCSKKADDPRALVIDLFVNGNTIKYYLA